MEQMRVSLSEFTASITGRLNAFTSEYTTGMTLEGPETFPYSRPIEEWIDLLAEMGNLMSQFNRKDPQKDTNDAA